MSLIDNISQPSGLIKLMLVLACAGVAGSATAQAPGPDYRFEFIANRGAAAKGAQSGLLRVQVLPPLPNSGASADEQAVPVVMTLDAVLYPGQWLVNGGRDQTTSERYNNQVSASDQEKFVLGKFTLFQTAEQLEDYRLWLDSETFTSFAESVSSGDIDLASDREFYQQYDNIRLLGSVRYGPYTLLYTQFRTAEGGELATSVMPARLLDGRLVTAGSVHASSHALYRLLAFGTLQQSLVEYLEARVNNANN
ncbi:MAG: hypothetical protein KJN90_01915 [Gammaproteobacteria bacterium]|nr:hypothetical protein [Gammaproteobacteria bacterium]